MRIDSARCTGCLECADFCPMDCILEREGAARIDEDECVECGRGLVRRGLSSGAAV